MRVAPQCVPHCTANPPGRKLTAWRACGKSSNFHENNPIPPRAVHESWLWRLAGRLPGHTTVWRDCLSFLRRAPCAACMFPGDEVSRRCLLRRPSPQPGSRRGSTSPGPAFQWPRPLTGKGPLRPAPWARGAFAGRVGEFFVLLQLIIIMTSLNHDTASRGSRRDERHKSPYCLCR